MDLNQESRWSRGGVFNNFSASRRGEKSLQWQNDIFNYFKMIQGVRKVAAVIEHFKLRNFKSRSEYLSMIKAASQRHSNRKGYEDLYKVTNH